MKRKILNTIGALFAMLTAGVAQAHVGTHGHEGLLAGLGHMLLDHGLLPLILGALAAIVLLRRQRAADADKE